MNMTHGRLSALQAGAAELAPPGSRRSGPYGAETCGAKPACLMQGGTRSEQPRELFSD